VRVGQYHDASEANVRAIAADESYIGQCRAQGFYPGAYYPHNIHFLWYTTSLEGRSRQCIEAARKVSDFALDLRCGAVEGPRLRHLTLLAHARFGRWDDLLNEPEPAVEYPFDQAMWHFARGLALVAKGEGTRAVAEQTAFEELAGSDAIQELDSAQFPALGILAVAREVLAGKLAGANGDMDAMIEHLEHGVTAEAALPYMEPPYWYHPVLQSLGAALLRHGKAAEAENAFRRDLDQLPRNGWGLFGLEQSVRAQGKAQAADGVRRDFERAWQHADVIPELGWY
jgi:tetratricopeptide (TPR) repeat protein